ncbi:MAG: phosphatase PAP2 family protein [Acutalibacteraceae bacterium]|jgi:membrane-associated phospholipid phosphatase
MEFLYLLEELRHPLLDSFFSLITRLGEETFFIVLGLIFFWCVNKKEGYYLLFIGFIGTVINQFLKLYFRIPRPWVKNKDFTIVEPAKKAAAGYSFPSGHTQSSIGIFGGMARMHNQKTFRIICVILCVLVPFSRLYLGVHTPLDVGVSAVLALGLVFGLYPLVSRCFENTRSMRILLFFMMILSAALTVFVTFYRFPENIDTKNLAEGTKNAYEMLGSTIGIYISYEVDKRYINFKTDGNIICQILKLGFGIIPVLTIKQGLKAPLRMLIANQFAADGVRYLILVLFIGCVWPLTFEKIRKFTEKK